MSYILFVRAKVRPDAKQAMEDAFRQMAAKARQEPGTLNYVVCQLTLDPNVFMVFEEFEDKAAFEYHQNTRDVIEFRKLIQGTIEEGPEFIMVTEIARK